MIKKPLTKTCLMLYRVHMHAGHYPTYIIYTSNHFNAWHAYRVKTHGAVHSSMVYSVAIPYQQMTTLVLP